MSLNPGERSFFEREREELDRLEQRGTRKFLKVYDFGASKLRSEIKRRPAQYFFLFITSFFGSVVTSSVALFMFSGNMIAQFTPKPEPEVKAVQTQNVQKVVETEKYDHLLLASKLTKEEDEVVIVDIRPEGEYKAGHIVTSVSIPVYESEMVTESGDLDAELVASAFEAILLSKKMVVIYGSNAYATLPAEIAGLLNKEGATVKPLAVGWEEWEHLYSN